MTKNIKVGNKTVEVNYDSRVHFTPIKIYVEDSIRSYNNSRVPPIGFKGYKIKT